MQSRYKSKVKHLCLGLIFVFASLNLLAEATVTSANDTETQSPKTTINYCVDPDWMPYEALSEGNHIGISSDYLAIIEATTEIQFNLLPTKTWSDSIELLKSGDCDMTTFVNQSPSRNAYLDFSDIYFTAPNVLVSLKEQPFLQGFENIGERSLAITKDYRILEYVELYFPKIKTIIVKSEKQGLDYVAQGKADLFVGSMLSVNAYIQQNGLFDLKIAGWAGPEDKLRIAVIKPLAHILPKINQAIDKIDEQQRIKIFNKWNNITVIDETNYQLYWRTLIIALIIFSILIIRYYSIAHYNTKLTQKNLELQNLQIQLEKTNKELSFFSNHDPLTKLYNRNYFNRKFDKDMRTNKKDGNAVCIIIIDIDHFKNINDEFGHNAGDEILKTLSEILASNSREKDVVVRWGGEEFVIWCNQSNLNDAKRLCERITQAIKQTQFPFVNKLTCSYGVAELKDNEVMINCLERADKALYQAKEQGRDQICCDEV